MATACYINLYQSDSDNRAHAQSEPWQTWEVDEVELQEGKPLFDWPAILQPRVKGYKEGHLDLEYNGRTYTIKAGEEVQLHSPFMNHEYGIDGYLLFCVKVINTTLTYKGGWQFADTILQKLAGPIGPGEVWYPNGDHFKGHFHLSYASINGPAYAACGRYTFADGSYIERAWIHTSSDLNGWGLHGVFRVHHPEGPDSIAMFCGGGRRYGYELFLPDEQTPSSGATVCEWYANRRILHHDAEDRYYDLEVLDYQIDETHREDCVDLTLKVKDRYTTYRVEQHGGRYVVNNYDDSIYDPHTRVTLWLPTGDSLDHNGYGVLDYRPYDGYVTVHCAATGMCRTEHWEKGSRVNLPECERDYLAAKRLMLPDPSGAHGEMLAHVWKDNHIEYNHGEWIYDGEMRDDRPEGKGVLVGDSYHNHRRYEGEFRHGYYIDIDALIGNITLRIRTGHKHWSIGGDGEWKYEEMTKVARLGKLDIRGFWNYLITEIRSDCITIEFYDKKYELRPDKPLHLYNEIEGDEWSDGCVYDGDDYTLDMEM